MPPKARSRIVVLSALAVALVLVHGALHTWRSGERSRDNHLAPPPKVDLTADGPTVGAAAAVPDQTAYVPPRAAERFSALLEFLRWRGDKDQPDKPGRLDQEKAVLKGKYMGVYVRDELREITATPEGIHLLAEFMTSGEDPQLQPTVSAHYPIWDYLRTYIIGALAQRPGEEVDTALYSVVERTLRTYEQLYAAKFLRDRDPRNLERLSDLLANVFQAKIDAGPQPGQPEDETLFYGLALATKFDRADLLPDLENWMSQMPEGRGKYVYGRCFHTFPGEVQDGIIRRLGPDHALLSEIRGNGDVSKPSVRDLVVRNTIARGLESVEVNITYDPQLRLREFDIYYPWIVDGEAVDESTPAKVEWLIARLEGYQMVFDQLIAVPKVSPRALAKAAQIQSQMKARLTALRKKPSEE